MLNFSAAETRYEPYPLVVLRPALDAKDYNELCDNFPDISLFGPIRGYDYKLSLSEKFAPDNYHKFIRENKPWNRFHGWLKSDDFIKATVEFLKQKYIDLDIDKCFETTSQRVRRMVSGGKIMRAPKLRSRFEFSVLKADGGEVAPHTDTPKKIITLVQTMIKDGEWDPAIGGGLDVNRATDAKYAFNWKNNAVPWDKIEVIDTIPFVPNQCTVFVKTFNSLHSVRRMTQEGSKALRKTVTIVIERDD
ncbi:hypothetical protein [Taklimakanibacter deserti]|uniref:hypothetical protein n=1 Tax=Taklimakanibacter deserti TaxID=2267839 RepID=UPI000E653E11